MGLWAERTLMAVEVIAVEAKAAKMTDRLGKPVQWILRNLQLAYRLLCCLANCADQLGPLAPSCTCEIDNLTSCALRTRDWYLFVSLSIIETTPFGITNVD